MLIRLNKANNWILGLLKKTASVTNGTEAPTATTAGQLGDVRFDTDGNRWELKHIESTNYYWSPKGFPAVNTEYFDCYCGGEKVWKKAIETTTAAAGGVKNTAHGITDFARVYDLLTLFMVDTTGNNLSPFYIGVASYFVGYVNSTNFVVQTPNAAGFNSRPVYLKFSYTKTV